jgi:IS1 family transposase
MITPQNTILHDAIALNHAIGDRSKARDALLIAALIDSDSTAMRSAVEHYQTAQMHVRDMAHKYASLEPAMYWDVMEITAQI